MQADTVYHPSRLAALSLSPLYVTQGDNSCAQFEYEDELIFLEYSTFVKLCFEDELATAAVREEVFETTTTGTVKPCHVNDSYVTQDKHYSH